MAALDVTILGCGSSPGVPRIGNDWGSCDPTNPKNKRSRASLLVERRAGPDKVTRVLIDTGPDMREQMIAANVDWVDAVLYTHPHADHIHGIDDLRAFVLNRKQRVKVYMDADTAERVQAAFEYCFVSPHNYNYPPILDDHRIHVGETLTIDGDGGPITAQIFRQLHGSIHSLGFRFGSFAYSTDLHELPEESHDAVRGLDTWIIGALRETPHPSHLSVDQAIALSEQMGARRTILTHMHNTLDYETLKARLPEGFEPGYDGMTFQVEGADEL
ncbi:MAG: phosphoribosyl 1,2-cyclic phosphodiesterase [Hyphomicrobiales bacterium]|nr:MAG: phosphoribosyl 1,2-cyclic phosphodiesterase [Hyphomicrobiales bacterium]